MSIFDKLFGKASKKSSVQKPTIKESIEIVRLLEIGKYEQAIVSIDNELKLEPQNSNLWFLKGSALFGLHKHIEASICLEKSTKLDPHSAHGWGLLGVVLVKLSRIDDAINAYKQYLTFATSEEDKYIAEVKHTLAGLERIRNTQQSSYQLINKEQAITLIRNAQVLMEERKYEQAIICYNDALQFPDFETKLVIGLLTLKSEAYQKLWKWQDVLECYDKVLELLTSQSEQVPEIISEAWANKGLALDMLKRDKEALAAYDKCLEMNPSAENVSSVNHNRERILTRLK